MSLAEYQNTGAPRSELLDILHEVSVKHGVSLAQLRASHIRPTNITAARREYYYRALTETGHYLHVISRVCGIDRSAVNIGAGIHASKYGLPLPRAVDATKWVLFRRRKNRQFREHGNSEIDCACGCGAKLMKYDVLGRQRRFVGRHNLRVINGGIAKCDGCGINRADPPSKLCPGCEAYQEHQR